MRLTVWHSFLARTEDTRCESYLREQLGYAGEASLVQVCTRYMQSTEHPACSLDVVSGRVRVDRPPAWAARLPAKAEIEL